MRRIKNIYGIIALILLVFPFILNAKTCHPKKVSIINMSDQAFEIVAGDGKIIPIPAKKSIRENMRLAHFFTAPCSMMRIQRAGQSQTQQIALFNPSIEHPSIRIEKSHHRKGLEITANSIGGHFKIKEMIKYHGVQPYLAQLNIEHS